MKYHRGRLSSFIRQKTDADPLRPIQPITTHPWPAQRIIIFASSSSKFTASNQIPTQHIATQPVSEHPSIYIRLLAKKNPTYLNMDSPSSALDQNIDLSKLTPKDRQELQQFIVNESQKARIQQCEPLCPFPILSLPISPGNRTRRCLNRMPRILR